MSAELAPASTLPARIGALPVTSTKIRAIVPDTLDDAFRLGAMIHASGLAPYSLKTREAVCAAVMYGMEIGLPPMQAVQSIAVIGGRPGIFGDAAIALVRQSGMLAGFRETVEGEGDERAGLCEVTRRNPDGTTETLTERFTVAQAKAAGLWTKTGRNGEATPWQLYPERMLKFRARGFALRDLFADVLKGLVTIEELQDIGEPPARDPPPAAPRRAPPPPPALTGPEVAQEPAQAAPAAEESRTDAADPTPVRRPPPPPGAAQAAQEPVRERTRADDLEDMRLELEATSTADEFDVAAEPWLAAMQEWSRADRELAQGIYEAASGRFA